MMKRMIHTAIGPWLKGLIVWALLLSFAAIPAVAEITQADLVLNPAPLEYEGGNIVLSKQAERIGPDEWKVFVEATVNVEVEPPPLEVVMLVDLSSSMRTNETEHKHTAACSVLKCDLHVHTEECYVLICDTDEHEHTYQKNSNNDCYSNSRCTTHKGTNAHEAAGCHKQGNNWYALTCTKDEHTHSYDAGCYQLTCNEEGVASHTHGLGCYACEYYGFKDVANPNNYGNNDNEYILNNYATRMAVAAVAAERLLASLPKDSTTITRLGFNSQNAKLITGIDSYYDVNTNTGTHLWQAIDLVLSGNYFTSNPDSTKVFVILNDGNANDSATDAIWEKINAFKETGTIFTVGFAEADDMLSEIAGGANGKYMMAANASELITAFDDLSAILLAMIEDPMSNMVGFDKDDIKITDGGGSTTTVDDTIYWRPSDTDDDTEGLTGTISYNYIVKLNSDADLDAGKHGNTVDNAVPLNSTTYFHYSINDVSKDAEFPIPYAAYGVSSVQTKWQYNGTDLLDPTEVEKEVGCDYKGDITNDDGTVTSYVPAFEQEYDVLTPTIQKDGVTYIYDSTTVTVTKPDGAVETYTYTNLADVDTVIASNPDAHVVVHNYLKAGQLVIDGTKVLEGREFEAGDAFTFELTATNGAPLPSPSTVTITPTAGSNESFRFPPITYNTVGTYTYTLQELLPEESSRLERMDYDTEPRTVVVTVTRNSSGVLNASYTVDGQTLPAVFTNRYALGNLLISKTVGGNMGSRNSEFDFTVTLPDMAGQTVSCTLDGSPLPLTLDDQGQATFTLRHDQTLVMSAVHGAYTVEEARFGSYVTNISVNDGDSVQTNSVSGTLGAGDTHATFLNTLNAEVPTGIATSTGAAIAGLMLSTALLAISRAGRRRRDAQ